MMESTPDLMETLEILFGFSDLDGLGDVALLDLARDARLERLKRQETFSVDENLDRHVYLIEGEVELVAGGRTMQTVTAGTERARSPLFRVHTPGLAARCIRDAQLLSLDEATFNRYAADLRPAQGAGIAVWEYSSPEEQSSLIGEIRQAFYHNEVDLPSLPDLAMKISHAVQDHGADFRRIAGTVQADPAIAARIVQVANSAMYAGVSRVESVHHAITRIGLQATRAIVMSVVVKNLFTPKSHLVHHRMKVWYQHSIRVGAISHALAAHLRGFDPEQAFLAGLMHDIGVLPVLIQIDERHELHETPELLEGAIGELAAGVGAMLLKQWNFEPEFVTVAANAENWLRDTKEPDYCDLVQVAQLHCSLVGGEKIDAPPMNEVPAFQRLELGEVDPVALIQEARQEISEIIGLLAS